MLSEGNLLGSVYDHIEDEDVYDEDIYAVDRKVSLALSIISKNKGFENNRGASHQFPAGRS
jgi:hypothetical protein